MLIAANRRARGGRALVFLGCILLSACESEDNPTFTGLRVYESPYSDVDWSRDSRLLAQHHDHIGADPTGILAYDAAGYDVVSLMDYSGNPRLRHALRERLWPPEDWVAPWALSSLKNIKFFIPNGEEIGISPGVIDGVLRHSTSPFVAKYIEGVIDADNSSADDIAAAGQYRSFAEMFTLIRTLGGTPCLAHPWNYQYDQEQYGDQFCTEIYSAFAAAQQAIGEPYYTGRDRNKALLENWDRALIKNQHIFGIAVNDHFGPSSRMGNVTAGIRDSGKILVMAKSATPEAYKTAFNQGAFLAIRDTGLVKGDYPKVYSIAVEDTLIFIETGAHVRWIANGELIGGNPLLLYEDLRPGTRYVRAEVYFDNGNTVYTQAFVIRPVGDADGDYDLDRYDDEICRAVRAATELDPLRIKACPP